VTAYPQFAAHAFDTGAIDFLIKPVRHARLETAVARLRDVIEQRDARRRLAELASQIDALRAEGGAGGAPSNEIWVHRRAERVRVDLDTVEMVQAEGEYVRLFVRDQSYLHRASIGSIAPVSVVPAVATTATGRTPAAMSASSASASASGRRRRASSIGRSRRVSAIAKLTIRMKEVAFIPKATSSASRAFRNVAMLSRARWIPASTSRLLLYRPPRWTCRLKR